MRLYDYITGQTKQYEFLFKNEANQDKKTKPTTICMVDVLFLEPPV